MKFYKSPNNDVYAYELDGSQDHLIPDDFIAISEDEAASINKAKAEIEFNSLSYAEKRAAEYPDFREYLDGIVKGDQAQIQSYIDACLSIKQKYPKPSGV